MGTCAQNLTSAITSEKLKLKRGSEEELKQKTSKILSSVMDRSRPLWDFTLLQGCEEDEPE